jgi:16S rRNA (guanine1207-N2)-methyltransferase
MAVSRLGLAQAAQILPDMPGKIAVFGPAGPEHLVGFAYQTLTFVPTSFKSSELVKTAGFDVQTDLTHAGHAIVVLPRAKAEAQDLIAQAIECAPSGWIVVDGAKHDGIESLLKLVGKVIGAPSSYSKAHGKCFWFQSGTASDLCAWRAQKTVNRDGFMTAPGVFSADGIDPGSALLAAHLPGTLKGAVAELGGGWGFLSHEILRSTQSVATVHIVEDNAVALECAKHNITDSRASFHWADATSWQAPMPLDAVVMNPPFHVGRRTSIDLGNSFIHSAAKQLRSGGHLYMVANAHLGYEPLLNQLFSKVEVLSANKQFKVLQALKSKSKPR